MLYAINEFNKPFQADETRISYLLTETISLLSKLMTKFLQMKHIKSEADVREITFGLAEKTT